MATGPNAGIDLAFKAAGDLSAGQHHGVEFSANDTVDYPDGTLVPCAGVLQNKPAGAGRGATIRILGHSKVMAGGTLAAMNRISMTTSGYFVATTSGMAPCGLCVKGANSGYPGEAIIVPNYLISATSAATVQG